jgi:hypothetical protein
MRSLQLVVMTMRIMKVKLTKTQLEAMPGAERTAVLLMGHASNEINLLRKLMLIMARHGQPNSTIVDHIHAGQTLILMRMLLGKCFEAWLMFTKRVQPLRDKYLSKLRPPFQDALKDLQKQFADGRMAAIRNQLAFHYGDDKNLVEAHWRKIPENDPWDFYLHDLNVNSFYYASELVITGVLTQLAIPDAVRGTPGHLSEETIGFAEVCKLNEEISGRMLGVLGEFIAVIVAETLPDVFGEDVDIGEPGKLSQLSLPFFWDADDYSACESTDAAD